MTTAARASGSGAGSLPVNAGGGALAAGIVTPVVAMAEPGGSQTIRSGVPASMTVPPTRFVHGWFTKAGAPKR